MSIYKIIRNFFPTVCLIVFFSAYAAAVNWRHDLRSAFAESAGTGKPVIVDFSTSWCGWCKKLDKDTFSNKMVQDLSSGFIWARIDGDKEKDLVNKYGVTGYPTVFFLDKDGKVIDRITGYLPPEEFVSRMRAVLGKATPGAGIIGKKGKNPFFERVKSMFGGKIARKPSYELSGIVSVNNGLRALINGCMVSEGDSVEGAKVVSIRGNSVKLLSEGEEIVLELPE